MILGLSLKARTHFRGGPEEPVAPGYAEAVSFHVGKGRVVIFGDATVFTSKIHNAKNEKEGMNRPELDNAMLATNTFRWLVGVLGN